MYTHSTYTSTCWYVLLCVPVAPAVGMYDTVYMVMRYGEVHGTNYYCIPSRRSTSHSLVQGTAVRSYILPLRGGFIWLCQLVCPWHLALDTIRVLLCSIPW